MTTHAELKKLARIRLADANALYEARRYAGAYYMAGYAIECAIKAILAKEFRA
jgi:HEPN domain-containing protein